MQAKQSNTASEMYSCLGTHTVTPAPPIPIFLRPSRLADGPAVAPFGDKAGPARTDVAGREGLLHDARNLIGAIGLYADLLSIPGVLRAEHREYADELRLIGSRSEALVERLLLALTASPEPESIASPAPEAAPAASTPEPVTLREVVEGCSGVLGRVAGGRTLELTFGPAAGVPIAAPRESIERILVNLVRNAATALSRRRVPASEAGSESARSTIRVMRPSRSRGFDDIEPGAIRIEAGLLPRTRRGSEPELASVQLAVEDSGCGMSEEQLKRTLRAAGAPQRSRGIGLRVVRELTSAAGAGLRISSAPNVGTRIEMDWPIQPAVAAESLEPRHQTLPSLAPGLSTAAERRMA